jgi:putative flippase GtrA
MQLVFKYSLFAIIATLANLLTQALVDQALAGAYIIYLAIGAGTVAGWVSKYLLDKHYIFVFKTHSAQEDVQKFLAYGLTGVVTTVLFWSFELGFDAWFGTRLARYLGAVIGLSIGYVVKYQLDKRFVFLRQEP